MNKTKLIDVAEHAGVSKSTVSQYLNGRYDYMSKATRARIEVAVKELNYVPNPIARSLKTDRTKTIGVVVRDITGYYTSRAIRGIDDYCKGRDYNVVIYNSDFDSEAEARALGSLNQLRVDGIIIAASGKNSALVSDLSQRLPVVHFQLEHDGSEKNVIISDYKEAAFQATEYLIGLGHRRICFLTQTFKGIRSRQDRYQGFVEALNKHGLNESDQSVLYWDRDAGFEQAPGAILEQKNAPTAIFSQHLAITTDLLESLAKSGKNIPSDVSVLGFDDIPMAEFFKVPITVVKQAPYDIGENAAKVLLEKVTHDSGAERRILIPCELVERESCKKI